VVRAVGIVLNNHVWRSYGPKKAREHERTARKVKNQTKHLVADEASGSRRSTGKQWIRTSKISEKRGACMTCAKKKPWGCE